MEYETEAREARVLDSITKLAPEDAGRVVIAGSHGGRYAACLLYTSPSPRDS